MSSKDVKKNLLPWLDRPVSFHRILAKACGDVASGLFLSQCIYWQYVVLPAMPDEKKNKHQLEGWFYKTREEWREETCLSRREQEGARKNLRSLGFLEEMLADVPAKLYFRVNLEALNIAFDPTNLQGGNVPTRELDTDQQEGTERTSKEAQNEPPFSSSESTSESAPEISRSAPRRNRNSPPQGGKFLTPSQETSSEEDLNSLDEPQAAPANPEEYEGVDLRFSQDIVAWMRDAAGVCGKHWKHGGKRGNKGPHKAMESPIREKERFVGRRNFRSWWVDFLRSPQSDEPMYPYGAFLEGPYQVRLNQLPPDPADAPPEIPGANDPFV